MAFQTALYYVKWLVIIQLSCGVLYTFFTRLDSHADTHTLNEERTVESDYDKNKELRDYQSLKRSVEKLPRKTGPGKNEESNSEEDPDEDGHVDKGKYMIRYDYNYSYTP